MNTPKNYITATDAIIDEHIVEVVQGWNYPNVTRFVNEIVTGMVANEIIIIKLDKKMMEMFTQKVRKQHYDDTADWFRDKIRSELNE